MTSTTQIMFKFIMILALSVLLTNCSSLDWAQGPRCGPGYRAHDVCFNKGENEQFHAQKEAARQGFVYGQGMVLNY